MITRLTRAHEHAVEELLGRDPLVNLFLLGFLAVHPIDRVWWYGVVDGDAVTGAVLVLPDRLCVPYLPEPGHGARLGRHLASLHRPCMTVGPRDQVDAMWETWAGGRITPKRFHSQRLYQLSEAPAGDPEPGFRKARYDDWRPVAVGSARMELEDLGHDPYRADPALHEQVVQERVKSGRTYVIEQRGEIVFQINVGTVTAWGYQIGGTWVPPQHRGRGWATKGVHALCQRLLTSTAPSRPARGVITLHVHEENIPAVRTYERVGFQRGAAYRLITV